MTMVVLGKYLLIMHNILISLDVTRINYNKEACDCGLLNSLYTLCRLTN